MRQGPIHAAKPTVCAYDQTIVQEFLALVQDLRQKQPHGASVDVDLGFLDWVEQAIQTAPEKQAQLSLVFLTFAKLLPTIRARIESPLLRRVEAEIDFTQLNWEQFEQLCVDLLEAEGFTNVVPSGGWGGDQGRDIAAQESITSRTGKQWTVQWMVQCKHYAVSGRSVGHRDVTGIIDFLSTHNADGLFVITDTSLTASLVKKLEEFDRDKRLPYRTAFWDGHRLQNLLLDRHPKLLLRYFPKPAYDWSTYDEGVSQGWIAPAATISTGR